jgi:hypothetical protein
MKKYTYLFLLLMLLLSSCSAAQSLPVGQEGVAAPEEESSMIDPTPSEALELMALAALNDYYQSLNQGLYERAVAFYGGSYEELAYLNPTIDPDEKAELLRAGCEFNGFMCLAVLSSELVQVENQQEFIFELEFANSDGSLFVLGPCCGADEETMPPVSVFTVQVRCDDEGLCQVLNLPPLVP